MPVRAQNIEPIISEIVIIASIIIDGLRKVLAIAIWFIIRHARGISASHIFAACRSIESSYYMASRHACFDIMMAKASSSPYFVS